MKITTLEEFVDFATLDTKKLFSKLKSHELSHKGRPNHDASFTSKALITSACLGCHDAKPPRQSHLFWSLLCLFLLQLPMSNMRAFLMTRLPCLQENFGQCISFRRRGEENPGVALMSYPVFMPKPSIIIT
jgi:hypothetical protein